jgi:hypothetical protein
MTQREGEIDSHRAVNAEIQSAEEKKCPDFLEVGAFAAHAFYKRRNRSRRLDGSNVFGPYLV